MPIQKITARIPFDRHFLYTTQIGIYIAVSQPDRGASGAAGIDHDLTGGVDGQVSHNGHQTKAVLRLLDPAPQGHVCVVLNGNGAVTRTAAFQRTDPSLSRLRYNIGAAADDEIDPFDNVNAVDPQART